MVLNKVKNNVKVKKLDYFCILKAIFFFASFFYFFHHHGLLFPKYWNKRTCLKVIFDWLTASIFKICIKNLFSKDFFLRILGNFSRSVFQTLILKSNYSSIFKISWPHGVIQNHLLLKEVIYYCNTEWSTEVHSERKGLAWFTTTFGV